MCVHMWILNYRPLTLVSTFVYMCIVCMCEHTHYTQPQELLPLKSAGDPFRSALVLMGERRKIDRCSKTPLHFLPSALPSISPSHYSCLLFILLHQTHTSHFFLWVLFSLPLFFLSFSFAQSHTERKSIMNILTRRNVTERGQKEKKIKCNDSSAVSVSWSKTMWMWKNGLGDIFNCSIHSLATYFSNLSK